MNVRTSAEPPAETSMIRRALDAAGYYDDEPTRENLVSCFSDYVDSGVWSNVELDDIEDMSISDMCRGLIRYKG